MEKSILISIKPAFAELIVEGIKKIELRRSFPEGKVKQKCFIYSSSPTQAVIGECVITKVEKLSIDVLWEKHSDDSMIAWSDFKEYFQGKEFGFALHISRPHRYEIPVLLQKSFNLSRPPQSFCYI